MGDPGLDPGEERWVGQNAHAIVQKKKNKNKNTTLNKLFGQPNS